MTIVVFGWQSSECDIRVAVIGCDIRGQSSECDIRVAVIGWIAAIYILRNIKHMITAVIQVCYLDSNYWCVVFG
jgi:hypothetical protein